MHRKSEGKFERKVTMAKLRHSRHYNIIVINTNEFRTTRKETLKTNYNTTTTKTQCWKLVMIQ